MQTTQELEALADKLPALIAAHKSVLDAKKKAMTQLQQAGLIYAAEHWRSGKYLYLIYPSRDGQRERKYVGTDETRIAEAKAAMQRAKDYDLLAAEASAIERTLYGGCGRLREAVALLAGARSW